MLSTRRNHNLNATISQGCKCFSIYICLCYHIIIIKWFFLFGLKSLRKHNLSYCPSINWGHGYGCIYQLRNKNNYGLTFIQAISCRIHYIIINKRDYCQWISWIKNNNNKLHRTIERDTFVTLIPKLNRYQFAVTTFLFNFIFSYYFMCNCISAQIFAKQVF